MAGSLKGPIAIALGGSRRVGECVVDVFIRKGATVELAVAARHVDRVRYASSCALRVRRLARDRVAGSVFDRVISTCMPATRWSQPTASSTSSRLGARPSQGVST